MKPYLLIPMVLMAACCLTLAADSQEFAPARERRRAFGNKLMARVLADAKSHPLVYALAGLYTGRNVAEANNRLRAAWAEAAGPEGKMTAALAGDEKVKWCMRGWLRIHYLFHDKSEFYPGRLDPDVQAKLEEMFFLYGCRKSTVKRADLRFIWLIQGSENHDMMDLSNAYLALQAVQGLKPYKARKLPDGHTPREHVKAWEEYYARYASERARNGLFVEISPTYGKWFAGELVNMYEFARSPLVRNRMEMLLHLMWADWSIDQLGGVRGGGKTRCYQGNYAQLGTQDSWDLMGRDLMGIDAWYWNTHGILSTMALATSRYELPDVVLDIALNRRGRKPFVYQSVRPAKLGKAPPNPPREEGYWMDGAGGRMLRYSYCAPECVMGSWMLDTRTAYAAINTQNRWQGVIFATGPNMRVFPQSVGLGNGKTYNQHVAVQHRNVMIVAHHPRAKQTGQMRVYFPKTLRSRLVERGGWVVLNQGGAWLGVRVLSERGNPVEKNYEFREGSKDKKNERNGYWLWPTEAKPPVAFVVSREDTHKTLDDFIAYLGAFDLRIVNERASCSFVDDTGARVSLQLGGELPVPRINGKPVNLQPEMVFDSPFVKSIHGSGIVTISKGKRRKVLNFTDQPGGKAEGKKGSMTRAVRNPNEQKAFEQASATPWREVFSDPCTGDWKEKWFLDGEIGTVRTGPDGMTLTAGPEFRNDAHHMVLWTKESFASDLKIEYDYTRLDSETRCVTILYIQATGSGKAPYAEDISKWNDLRKVPSMKTYFNHMNAYHISYAAFPNKGEDRTQYIRGRRYMPERTGLRGTGLEPDYCPEGLFGTGVKHHITAIKKDRDLFMRIENPGQVYYCRMSNPKLPVIAEGRIGLRHMYTRSARYKNIRVSVRAR